MGTVEYGDLGPPRTWTETSEQAPEKFGPVLSTDPLNPSAKEHHYIEDAPGEARHQLPPLALKTLSKTASQDGFTSVREKVSWFSAQIKDRKGNDDPEVTGQPEGHLTPR